MSERLYGAAADGYAKAAGIDPGLLRAVIKQESRWNPRAVSHAGAMGLCQIMPPTWAELSAKYGSRGDPYDPHDNMRLAALYLRDVAKFLKSKGVPATVRNVTAAYNGGMGMVSKHHANGKGESAWPAESLDYAGKVSAFYAANLAGSAVVLGSVVFLVSLLFI